jgi:hypothetical protein
MITEACLCEVASTGPQTKLTAGWQELASFLTQCLWQKGQKESCGAGEASCAENKRVQAASILDEHPATTL